MKPAWRAVQGGSWPAWQKSLPLFCCILAVLLGGCAKIKNFRVSPSVACPGDEVTVTWETNGKTTLGATPPVEGLGPAEKSGTLKVTVSQPTRIQIKASRSILPSTASTEAAVRMAAGEFESGLVDAEGEARFECPGSNRTLSATLALGNSQYSPSARIERVTNMNARPVVISTGTLTETLAPSAATRAFENQPVQGDWRLEVPLLEGESCEAADDAVSGRLLLKLQISCQR